MKKTALILILGVVGLIGVGIWLLNDTNPGKLQRTETIIDVKDTFEK